MGVLDNLCRICAYKLESIKTNVFAPENSHVLSTIMQFIPISIQEDDSYPKNICSVCLTTLINFNELRAKSLVAVEIFKNTLSETVNDQSPSENRPVDEITIKVEYVSDAEIYEEPECKFNTYELTETSHSSFECDNCCRIFKNKKKIINHFRQCSPSVAHKMVENSGPIRRRRRRKSDTPLQCQHCEKMFTYKSHLTRHQWTHDGKKPFPCNLCDKKFSQKGHLTQHQRTHNGEKPFQCSQCARPFSSKTNLIQHERRHNDDKPFHCEECGKSFCQKIDLKQHQRIHKPDKPFQCDECPKSFPVKWGLIKHQRRHRGDKPFQCEECPISFCQKIDLDRHMRRHNGEKPYQCEICSRRFTRREHLIDHHRTHNGEKPFQCDECPTRFSQKVNLLRHKRTHLRKSVLIP